MFENKDSLTHREKKIRKLASEWLVEREEGWEPGREAEFNAWKSKDIRHEIALRELESSWNRLKQLRRLIDEPTLRPNPDIFSTGTRVRQRRRKTLVTLVGYLAAVIALMIGVWMLLSNESANGTPSPTVYSTTLNDYKQIVLEDGSVMEMNANTQVHINFTDTWRQMRLLSGEAHFIVEKDTSRPFIVDAGSVSVKAVGTAFNVRFDSEEVQVLVIEGRVKVNSLSIEHENARESDPPLIVPELIAGDQATFFIQDAHPVPLMSKVKMEESKEILAWKGPRLFFDATPLEKAVEQFNEHNEVKVVIEGDKLRNLSIGGSFLVEDVEAFIRLLAGEGSIIVERTDYEKVILKPAY